MDWFYKRQNYGNSKNFNGYQGLEEAGMNRWSTGDFFEKNFLYDTITVDIDHYLFVQIHRMYNNTTSES